MAIFIGIAIVILYLLIPSDIIPDIIPGWGWIDDAVVVYLIWRILKKYRESQALNQESNNQSAKQNNRHNSRHSANQQNNSQKPNQRTKTPYEILEINPSASQAEIKKAYRKLANQYHPDKVAHLGNDIKQLAEQRFKEIQQAYQTLTRK